jgi:hypothetical protein
MPTARAIIRGALTDLGVASAEEPLSASQCEDALDLLNQLLDSFSTERLWIYYLPPTPIVWPAGAAMQTWGPGGDIPTPRPIKLATHATYRDAGADYDYPLEVLERQEQYAQISWKALPSTIPIAVYYAPNVPLGELSLWPTPSVDVGITVFPWQPLGAWAHLDDDLLFPPGYARALRLALALECAPSYGVQPNPLLVRREEQARQAIQVPNTDIGRLQLYPGSGVPSSGLADFMSGRY